MAYFVDLACCDYFRHIFSTEKLKAVGWLAQGYAYPQRQTGLPDERFRKLLLLLKNPWEPGCFMGCHDCEFCVPESQVPGKEKGGGLFSSIRNAFGPEPLPELPRQVLERFGMEIRFGFSNLFVPGQEYIFVAPSMIAHYIDSHKYDPPAEFWHAVLDCPEMGSDSYKKALLTNGPSDARWINALTYESRLRR